MLNDNSNMLTLNTCISMVLICIKNDDAVNIYRFVLCICNRIIQFSYKLVAKMLTITNAIDYLNLQFEFCVECQKASKMFYIQQIYKVSLWLHYRRL